MTWRQCIKGITVELPLRSLDFPSCLFHATHCQSIVHAFDQFLDPDINHLGVFVGRGVDFLVSQDALQVFKRAELLASRREATTQDLKIQLLESEIFLDRIENAIEVVGRVEVCPVGTREDQRIW